MKDLLDNVSLFWRKYFKDVDVLDSILEGALSATSNLYSDSMAYFLSNSIESVPLTLSKQYCLLELEDSNFLQVGGYLVYDLGVSPYRHISYISPSPKSSDILEIGVDYSLLKGSDLIPSLRAQLDTDSTYIIFSSDPRGNESYRREQEYILGKYVLEINDASFTLTSEDPSLNFLEPIYIKDLEGNLVQECKIALFDSGKIYLHVSTPLKFDPSSCLFSLKEEGIDVENLANYSASTDLFTHENNVTIAWGLNCEVDTFLLGRKFGYMFDRQDISSSEKYRNYVLGLSLLRTAPFTSKTIKASICLTCNVPVFSSSFEEGDRIIRVIKSPRATTVETTLAKYEIPPELTLLPSIESDAILVETIDSEGVVTVEADRTRDSSHSPSFKFSALDPMISDISIKTQKSDSSWWDRGIDAANWIEIPSSIMINESQIRRLLVNHVHPNIVGETSVGELTLPPAAVGDYGIYVGDATRNTVAYNLFRDFIQHHFVFIELSAPFISRSGGMDSSLFTELRKELDSNSTPGTLVVLSSSLDANLADDNLDGIPDILQ